MVPKRYTRKIWMGFNPRKAVVMASETATRKMIKAETLKTVSSKVCFSELPTINDNRWNLSFFSLCIFRAFLFRCLIMPKISFCVNNSVPWNRVIQSSGYARCPPQKSLSWMSLELTGPESAFCQVILLNLWYNTNTYPVRSRRHTVMTVRGMFSFRGGR